MTHNPKDLQINKRIFISTSSFAAYSNEPLNLLREKSIEFKLNPYNRTLKETEIAELLKNMDGVIAGTEPLTKKVFENCPLLKVISRVGAGLDNVDLKSAEENGIKVFNTPEGPTQSVAELTLVLILSLLRKINVMDKNIKNEIWKKEMGSLLFHKKIGIIGFGNIGKRLAELLSPFNCRIMFYDPYIGNKENNKYEKIDSVETLLENSDIVSLHMFYSKQNHHFINKEMLLKMKPTAILVNTARGGLVDEDALYESLKEFKIAGAALDVFEKEPYQGKLKEFPNVLLTPHIGSYAIEARIQMEMDAVLNLFKGFEIG